MAEQTLNRSELLKDSEATLREVAGILLEVWDGSLEVDGLRPTGSSPEDDARAGRRLVELVGILMRTYREIQRVLSGIRTGRGILQQAAMERVQKTHQKLEEVTMTTEVAATDMLDGLDKALSLVDAIAPPSAEGSAEDREAAGEELREELNRLIILMQFQDITAQQLAHAAGVLVEVEKRLEGLTKLFDFHNLDADGDLLKMLDDTEEDPAGPDTFDPAATTDDAEARQALADEVFVSGPPASGDGAS